MRSVLGRVRAAVGRLWWLGLPAEVRGPLLVLAGVLATGTIGFSLIEGWDPWRSLFFTLITVTTVGYGDYGLSPAGERFDALVMLGGIAAASYAVSRVFQGAITHALRPEKRMLQRIRHMDGHYIVCGFGRMGQRVARHLVSSDVPIVVLDRDEKLIEQARELGMVAIAGDATEDGVLSNAGVERATALAALTSSDSVNAMICLTAHAIAPELHIVSRAEDESSVRKMSRAGANRVVSPTAHGGDGVAQCLLRPEIAGVLFGEGGSDHALTFSELEVRADSALAGRTIRGIGERCPRVIFVAEYRAEHGVRMRPDADRPLEMGDVLIVAGTHAEIREMKFAMSRAA